MHLWTHWFQCYTHTRIIHRVKWRHSNLWSQYDLYAVGNTAYCVRFSGGDLSRYSNKIESDGLRKCPYYRCLTLKMMSRITNIFQSLLHNMAGKTAGMDMVWRNYVTVTPCIQASFVSVQSSCAFSVDPVSVPVSFESAPECQKSPAPDRFRMIEATSATFITLSGVIVASSGKTRRTVLSNSCQITRQMPAADAAAAAAADAITLIQRNWCRWQCSRGVSHKAYNIFLKPYV